MQVKLLRALQEREIRRVGENKSRPVDVRVRGGDQPRPRRTGSPAARFRQDLYYRLNVVELRVPPLRERREDILPLARVLLADAAQRMKRKIAGLSPARRRSAPALRLAGQRARAGERDGARGGARARRRVELEDLPEEVRLALPVPVAAAAGAAAGGDGARVHPRGAGAERRQPTQHRGAARHRRGDAVPQAQELWPDRRKRAARKVGA